MKSYAASLTLHIAGLLVAVTAGVYTLMHGLWFCAVTSSAAVISLCVSLYRMQTRQIRLMRRIVDCMRGNDLSQLACPAFGDKETRQLAEDLSAALKAIRIRMNDEETKHQYYENLLDRVDTAGEGCFPDGRTEWMDKAGRLMRGTLGELPRGNISSPSNR